ncbi:MAG: hypothetical protein AAF677_04845 [Pseudomonadota bacterium]
MSTRMSRAVRPLAVALSMLAVLALAPAGAAAATIGLAAEIDARALGGGAAERVEVTLVRPADPLPFVGNVQGAEIAFRDTRRVRAYEGWFHENGGALRLSLGDPALALGGGPGAFGGYDLQGAELFADPVPAALVDGPRAARLILDFIGATPGDRLRLDQVVMLTVLRGTHGGGAGAATLIGACGSRVMAPVAMPAPTAGVLLFAALGALAVARRPRAQRPSAQASIARASRSTAA